jgi:predicted SAM-dependent methyltransferase
MKLHLGCGNKKWDDYINIDLKWSDWDCDITKLPFGSETAEEIVAIHVVEHFLITEVSNVLAGWRRVLKEGGALVLELPCWDKVKEHIKSDGPENMTRWALYGEPSTHKDGFPALHKWCYSRQEMNALLKSVGFSKIKEETPLFHQPSRDMRWVATK